jgi:60kDa lysophospholipase
MKLALKSDFCNEVSIVRIYPGHFTTLAQTIAPPLKGLILQTFGAGNGPDQDHYFLSTLKEACDRGLVVVNVTQCHRGSVEAHYATGTALTEAGVISGIDMTCEAALVKLGWLLANYPNNPKKVREMMMLNIRGELTQQSNTLDASEASNNQSGHHGGSDTSGKPDNSDNSGISLESSNFLDVVFNVLQDNNKIQKTNGGIAELNAMDNIQKALLPTLMCAAASQGLTEDLKNMIFSNTGGTGKVSSALCAKLGDYDKRTALHLASSEGHVETVKFLLSLVEESDEKIDSQYVNVSAIDRFGTTPLRNAIDGGHLECVKLLANAGAKLSGMKHSILAHRLNQLVMDNEVDVLKLYILYGKVNVNVWDYDRRSPLHIAAAEGREECVDLLLKCGANPEFKDRWGCNSIQEAEKNGHKNILALLEKKK